jgi:DNA-binding transcriptional MerR regulator
MTAKIAEDTTGLLSIGQLAQAAGVSSRTIRYYEELGILPEPRRSPGGTRKYPSEYRSYIDIALALKDLGFRLDEIKPLTRVALGRSVSAGQRDTAARLVEERITALGRQVAVLCRLRESVRDPAAAAAAPVLLAPDRLQAVPALAGAGPASNRPTGNELAGNDMAGSTVADSPLAGSVPQMRERGDGAA